MSAARSALPIRVAPFLAAALLLLVTTPVLAAIRIDEVGIRCPGGGARSGFVELSGTLDDQMESRIGLLFSDASGQTIADVRPIFGRFVGTTFFYSNKFLITAPDFSIAHGGGGDVTLDFDLDPARGRVALYRLNLDNSRTVLHQLAYGGPGEVPAPPPGGTIVRTGSSTFGLTADGTPRGYFVDLTETTCFHTARWTVSEVGFGCWNGDAAGQFAELRFQGAVGTYDPAYHLYVYDRSNTLVADIVRPFGDLTGSACVDGAHVLVAGSSFGATADAALPVALDLTAGRVEISRPAAPVPSATSTLSWSSPSPASRSGLSLTPGPAPGDVVLGYATPRGGLYSDPFPPDCYYPGPLGSTPSLTEVGLQCANGGLAGQFVELQNTYSMFEDPRVFLRILGPDSTLIGEQRIFGRLGSAPLEFARHLLLGGAGFEAANELAPDLALSIPLPLSAGHIQLSALDALTGQRSVYDELAYGRTLPAPGPGQSLQRQPSAGWIVSSSPDPTRYDGVSARGSRCYSDQLAPTVRLSEVMTRCRSVPGSSFVELVSTRQAIFSSGFFLRHLDHTGTLTWEQHALFGSRALQAWPPGNTFLLATDAASGQIGTVDQILARPLDPAGGRLQLLYLPADGGAAQLSDELAYGTLEREAPAPGTSLVQPVPGEWSIAEEPTPQLFGLTPYGLDGSLCLGACQPNFLNMGSGTWRVLGNRSVFDRFGTGSLDQITGAMTVHAFGRAGVVGFFGDDFTLEGPAPGALVPVTALWHPIARYDETLPPSVRGRVRARFQLRDARTFDVQEFDVAPGAAPIPIELMVRAGEPFQLTAQLTVSGARTLGVRDSSAEGRLELAFAALPPGTRITSCYGYESSPPVAAEIALAEASFADGVAHLRWFAAGERPLATVERRGEGSDWTALADIAADGSGFYTYDDASLSDARRYAYRLAWAEAGARRTTSETWLDTATRVAFALHGVQPNPLAGAGTLAFTLDRAGEVRVDVLDVAGRRVLERRWTLGAGEHAMPLARAGELRPGVYVVRVEHADRRHTARVVVTR